MPAPPNRFSFRTHWDELMYLRGKLSYWLYEANRPSRARRFAARAQALLSAHGDESGALRYHEIASLALEAERQWLAAAGARERELELVGALWEEAARTNSRTTRDYMLDGYRRSDVVAICRRLITLYQNAGDAQRGSEVAGRFLTKLRAEPRS